MCLYRIGAEKLCPTRSFPDIHTVALIHCSRDGINNVLTPTRFPNLKKVHYLSAHPGQVDIYRRFSQPIQWLFPNRKYLFYNCMMEAGLGRVENHLIRNYIYSLRTIPYEIQLNLPNFGTLDGATYRSQLIRCLQESYVPANPMITLDMNDIDSFDYNPYFEGGSSHSLSSYIEDKKDEDFFRMIMDDCEKEEKNKERRLCHYP